MTPTAYQLQEADRWQALAADENRPAFREACEDIAQRLRHGWTSEPPAADETAKKQLPRDVFAKMRREVERANGALHDDFRARNVMPSLRTPPVGPMVPAGVNPFAAAPARTAGEDTHHALETQTHHEKNIRHSSD